MGPLVPEIISNEFNFIIAFIIGIFFGFALEQAGFSSTKKLVGLFYGYDFTVLKVFFTAGVTAMTGVLLLTHLGYLDMRMVYINPTYLNSAIIGGVIMGAGFIVGGFCPGTSVCAAAVGKLDAWSFIGGSLLGVLAFAEFYPLIEGMYLANNMGDVTMYEMLNISPELFGILLALIAIAAFYFTGLIEDKVNGIRTQYSYSKVVKYAAVAVVPFIFVSFVSFTPNQKEYLFAKAEKQMEEGSVYINIYDLDHLADELAHQAHRFNVIDIRSAEAFKEFSIPTSVNVPLDSMLKKEYHYLYKKPYKVNVFYGENEEDAKKAYLLASMLGDADNYVLLSNAEEFRQLYYEPVIPPANAPKEVKDRFQFRMKIGTQLQEIEERLKNLHEPVKKEIKKVQGGCA
ncbi:MAG: YeeE/YedE thiosulfate transporter family protein [Candidatus Cyclobacteriaceae bacterium M3_2C_046]